MISPHTLQSSKNRSPFFGLAVDPSHCESRKTGRVNNLVKTNTLRLEIVKIEFIFHESEHAR